MALEQTDLDQINQAITTAITNAFSNFAGQFAGQTAQQIGQQVGETMAQAMQKFLQTQGQQTGAQQISGRIENADIGGAERTEKESMDDSGFMFANDKRTYDEYMHESLESIRRNSAYIHKVLSDNHSVDLNARHIANQALAKMVENGDLAAKEAFKHSDIAADRQWNVDEQGWQVTEILRDQAFKEGLAAAVTNYVNSAWAAKANEAATT